MNQMNQIYLPNEIFTNILSYCNDDIKTKHNKNQIIVNKQIIRISEVISFEGLSKTLSCKISYIYCNIIDEEDEYYEYSHFKDWDNEGGFFI
jgi:hypothetical protein